MIFELRGSSKQVAIVQAALSRIFFPWGNLTAPEGNFIIGWTNLNSETLAKVRAHNGPHTGTPKGPEDTELIEGEINGRKYTLGVFYPYSGNIYIDNALVNYPEVAQETVSAELAHLCDYFLPLTDEMREQISLLMHNGKPDNHSWWEKVDYEREYYSLVGEGFMQAFTLAYSDMPFDNSGFVHGITKEQAPELRKIIGIERTDMVVKPEYKKIGTSKIFHDLRHYPLKPGKVITDTKGLIACKTCKVKYKI